MTSVPSERWFALATMRDPLVTSRRDRGRQTARRTVSVQSRRMDPNVLGSLLPPIKGSAGRTAPRSAQSSDRRHWGRN
ncbi:MAG: hypothetical protein KatS3mg060_3060 [Dehalococcoidia bacterium]|nr:MAG: hypothetical protein KatS3mg060_3060 [Dehalococcoidia bacterium]